MSLTVLVISFIAGGSHIKQEPAERKIIQQSLTLQERNSKLMEINEEKLQLIEELMRQ